MILFIDNVGKTEIRVIQVPFSDALFTYFSIVKSFRAIKPRDQKSSRFPRPTKHTASWLQLQKVSAKGFSHFLHSLVLTTAI